MQAIVTKYLGPTNSRGSRVKATASAGSITVIWDDALSSENNHLQAAQALVSSLGWDWGDRSLIGGELPGGRGNVYLLVGKRYESWR